MQNMFVYLAAAAAVVTLILFIGVVLARLYRRATPQVALVRTGSGGRRVIKDGGAIIIPALHEVTKVNMQSVPIRVRRSGDEALITRDSMRTDVEFTFFVRVADDEDAIMRAAQTLGDKTFKPGELADMIDAKVVDAARAAAAGMDMQELHSNRKEFVNTVQAQLAEDLMTNGLTLENVSLVALDQADFDNLSENNVFNATARTNVVRIVTEQNEARAKREAEAQIAIAEQRNAAAMRDLELKRDLEERQAETNASIENARNARRAEQESAKETADRDIELARQARAIAVSEKSEAESVARARADAARAEAISAEESVKTAAAVSEAERIKRIRILKAEEEAEAAATAIKVQAAAERTAAEDRASAVLAEARAEADAEKIRAEARREAGLADAEATRAMVSAENGISPAIVGMRVDLARIEAAPKVLAEIMRPTEKIESIRIFQGLNGLAGGAGSGGGADPSDLADVVTRTALRQPAAQAIGQMIGLQMTDGVNGVIGGMMAASEAAPAAREGMTAPDVSAGPDATPVLTGPDRSPFVDRPGRQPRKRGDE